MQLLWLDSIAVAQAAEVGGKALHCALLRQAGVLVPDGFVLLEPHALRRQELQDALEKFPAPARFAVRSSAPEEDQVSHSLAGLHDTILNVAVDDIPAAVRDCLRSLYAPRALAYRLAVGLPDTDLRMAVLVQQMARAVVSGVAFSFHPTMPGDQEILIHATWGLGEATVSGTVETDEYRVQRASGDIAAKRLGSKQRCLQTTAAGTQWTDVAPSGRRTFSLTDPQVKELAGLVLRIETILGWPVDVEFCHDGATFWILQARPITAAQPTNCVDVEWTRANLAEILPEVPCPQVAESIVSTFDHAMRSYYGPLLAPQSELGRLARTMCGRPWFNLSQLRYLCRASGAPAAPMLASMGHAAAITEQDRHPERLPLMRAIPAWGRLLRVPLRHLGLERTVRRYLRRIRRVTRQLMGIRLQRLSDARLREIVMDWKRLDAENFAGTFLVNEMTAWRMALEALCPRLGLSCEKLVSAAMATGTKTVDTKQALDLMALAAVAAREPLVRGWLATADLRGLHRRGSWRAALDGTRFLQVLDEWLDRYGHRGTWESDWSLPRYQEDLFPILHSIREQVADGEPSPNSAALWWRHGREASEYWSSVRRRCRGRRRAFLPAVRFLVGQVKRMYVLRHRQRFAMARLTSAYRSVHLEAASRFVERGWIEARDDYFFLYLDEVAAGLADATEGERLGSTAARRRGEHAAFEHLNLPLLANTADLTTALLGSDQPPMTSAVEARSPTARQQSGWKGTCLSPGSAHGEVVIIESPTDFSKVRRGSIVVGRAADPSWIPVFALAAGVILELGGQLSHAATMAREQGLPVVAGVPDARRLFCNGEHVHLDASLGQVLCVSPAACKE